MPGLKFVEGSEIDIEGLLAPFGGSFAGKDLAGEFFSKDTDFCLDWYSGDRPALFHHGLDGDVKTSVIGRIKSVEVKADLGLWMQGQLDASNEYYDAIKQLIKQGKLGLSSGSMNHLVQVNSKTGEILRWPLVEGSLTPTPCEPTATVDFASAKSHFKAIGIELPAKLLQEGDVAASVNIPDAPAKTTNIKTMEGSYEDLLEDLNALVNPRSPFYQSDCWAYIVATFPDYCIVCRRDYGDDEAEYYRCEYTLDAEGEPVLGTCTEVEQAYVPVQEPNDEIMAMPMAIHSASVTKYAAALVHRTKDVYERRIKEGRTLSGGNRKNLEQCLQEMKTACDALQSLLDSTVPQPAKAATVRRDIELLQMYAATL